MSKKQCRYCGQFFHDVEFGEGFTEPDGRHHFITGPSGDLSGDVPASRVRAAKKRSLQRKAATVEEPVDQVLET
jgi:hypothetical protein